MYTVYCSINIAFKAKPRSELTCGGIQLGRSATTYVLLTRLQFQFNFILSDKNCISLAPRYVR